MVLAQQASDPRFVNALTLVSDRRRIRVRAILEEDYLFEDTASPTPWTPSGDNEADRAAFAALARAAIRVRFDGRGGSLMHSNLVIAGGVAGAESAVLLASANFTRSNFAQHLNASVRIVSDSVAASLMPYAERLWGRSTPPASVAGALPVEPGAQGTLTVGPAGEGQDAMIAAADRATATIDLAMFNIALNNPGYDSVVRALQRGVTVRGVVDGDQLGNAWDAVPTLRGMGADIRYLDGKIASGLGRMHQKTLLVDDRIAVIGTSNFSTAARQSHEAVAMLDADQLTGPWPVAQYVKLELDRLFVRGQIRP